MASGDAVSTTPCPVGTAQLGRGLETARREELWTDCRLVVGGERGAETKEFPAHRVVLAAASPFFAQLFRLRRQEPLSTVAVSNCSVGAVEAALVFVYSGELRLSNDADAAGLLHVANLFHIPSLQNALHRELGAEGTETPPALSSAAVTTSEEAKAAPKASPSAAPKRRAEATSGGAEAESVLKRFCGQASACLSRPGESSGSDLSVPYGDAGLPAHDQPSPTLPTALPSPMPNNAFPDLRALAAADVAQGGRGNYLGPLLPTRPSTYAEGQTTPARPTPTPLPSHASLMAQMPHFFSPAFFAAAQAAQAQMAAQAQAHGPQGSLLSPKRETLSSPVSSPKAGLTSSGCHSAGTTRSGTGSHSGASQELPSPHLPSPQPSTPVTTIAADSGIMVPSNDKEGWCRNKKYIQKVGNGFKCTVCNKVYGRYNSVSYHVTIYHRNPPIRCDEPGCQFTTREARYIHFHKYYRHGTQLPETIDLGSRSCPFCRHVAKSPAMLEKHVARHLPAGSAPGKAAEIVNGLPGAPQAPKLRLPAPQATPKGLKREAAPSTASSPRPPTAALPDSAQHGCDQCSYKGQSSSSLEQHKLFKHSRSLFGNKFTCEVCGYSSASRENLDAHRRRHHFRQRSHQDGSTNSDTVSNSGSSGQSGREEEEEEESVLVVDEDAGQGPAAPPPSTASGPPSTGPPSSDLSDASRRQLHSSDATGGEESMSPDSSEDLDDSHSKLLARAPALSHGAFTTTVDYGTL